VGRGSKQVYKISEGAGLLSPKIVLGNMLAKPWSIVRHVEAGHTDSFIEKVSQQINRLGTRQTHVLDSYRARARPRVGVTGKGEAELKSERRAEAPFGLQSNTVKNACSSTRTSMTRAALKRLI